MSKSSSSGKAALAGTPGAIGEVEDVQIVVRNLTKDLTDQGAVQPDGSFSFEVSWAPTEKLEMWVEQKARASKRVPVLVPPQTKSIFPPPTINASKVIGGQTTVTGTAQANLLVLIGNTTRGLAGSTQASGAGTYSIKIDASSGDQLTAFVVNTANREASPVVKAQVPGP